MSRACLVIVLLFALLPLQGFAQPLPGPEPAASEQAPPPPKGELIPVRWEPEGLGRRMGRIALEGLSGLLTASLVGGTLIAVSYGLQACESCSSMEASTLLAVAGVAGTFGGLSAGVMLGGHLVGGQGRYLPTLAGSGLGLLAGGAVAAVLATQGAELLAVPPLVLGPLVGAIIGYELSHSSERASAAQGGSGVAVLPAVSARPSGGVLVGMLGSF